MQAKGARCGYNDQCPPLSPWQIEFNNPLDESAFDPAWVTIQPELPAAKISAQGNYITIQGRSQGRTTYRIQVSAALRDTFDQTLGNDNVFTIKVGSAYPSVSAPGGNFLVLDPSAKQAELFDLFHQLRAAEGDGLPRDARRLGRVQELSARFQPERPAACATRRPGVQPHDRDQSQRG